MWVERYIKQHVTITNVRLLHAILLINSHW